MNEKQDELERRPVADANTPGMGIKAFCTRVRRFRESYREDVLTGMSASLVKIHLKDCDECARYYED